MAAPVATAFGPVRNPASNVVPLHRAVVSDKRDVEIYGYRPRCDELDAPVDLAEARKIDLYKAMDEQARAAVEADERRDLRFHRLQAFIHWACIGIALVTLAYFMLRGAV